MQAGIIHDHSIHYLDHLAPFCALHNWPLIVFEEAVATLAKAYYPDLTLYRDCPPSLTTLVSCETRPLLERVLGPLDQTTLLWLPHGHSDKGWKVPFFESLRSGETPLIYGQRMLDVFEQKNPGLPCFVLGDFRLTYYQKHQPFYQKLLLKTYPFLKKRRPFFYAPTWDDAEENSTFTDFFSSLIKHLPSKETLLVKIHPNTYLKKAPLIEHLIGSSPSNVHFLLDFPSIHPLLAHAKAYLGDMSSVGYDALFWKTPLFFFVTEKKTGPDAFLMQAGTQIMPQALKTLFTRPLFPNQSTLYTHVYSDFQHWG